MCISATGSNRAQCACPLDTKALRKFFFIIGGRPAEGSRDDKQLPPPIDTHTIEVASAVVFT